MKMAEIPWQFEDLEWLYFCPHFFYPFVEFYKCGESKNFRVERDEENFTWVIDENCHFHLDIAKKKFCSNLFLLFDKICGHCQV